MLIHTVCLSALRQINDGRKLTCVLGEGAGIFVAFFFF